MPLKYVLCLTFDKNIYVALSYNKLKLKDDHMVPQCLEDRKCVRDSSPPLITS